MSDIKRTFLTGLLVAGVLILMPLYFNLIGYEDSSTLVALNDPAVLSDETQRNLVPKNVVVPDFDHSTKTLSPQEKNLENQAYYISNNKFDAVLSNIAGGSLIEYTLNGAMSQYRGGYNDVGEYQDSIPVSLILNNDNKCAPCIQLQNFDGKISILDVPFKLESSSSAVLSLSAQEKKIVVTEDRPLVLVFKANVLNMQIIKTVTLTFDSFVMNHQVDIAMQPMSNNGYTIGLVWNKGLRNTEYNIVDEVSYSLSSIGINKAVENISLSPKNISDRVEKQSFDGADWAAIRNKYFIMAMVPEGPGAASFESSSFSLNESSLVPSYSASIGSSDSSRLNCDIFLGPLDLDYINELDTYLDRIMNFGWFVLQPFSRSVLWLLKFLHGLGINYGIILILFAFIIRLVTGPLTKKSHESSQKMQALQPKLQSLQEKYKKDPQKLNQETIKLYKESGTNPLGGCLPMVLQMPLLFSLFIVFRSTIEFRGAPFFGWISNLSQPDTIINLPINIPLYGDQIAFLPILLGVTMFLSQKISMASMDPKQKPFMYIMSAFFYLIFNSFPSGLNLYYVVYNILNYLQQKSLKKAA